METLNGSEPWFVALRNRKSDIRFYWKQSSERLAGGLAMNMPAGEFRPLTKKHETDRDAALRRVANAVHQLNEAVIRAVGVGLSVELVRTSRFHDQVGNWGDQMVPMIRDNPASGPA